MTPGVGVKYNGTGLGRAVVVAMSGASSGIDWISSLIAMLVAVAGTPKVSALVVGEGSGGWLVKPAFWQPDNPSRYSNRRTKITKWLKFLNDIAEIIPSGLLTQIDILG